MALKPTIYKFSINLADLDQDFYTSLHLTVALHPSETLERMMARLLAFCLNAAEPQLTFTKGLSEIEEPDIWARTLDDQIALWIELGEPDVERVKKACHQARQVKVYSFNSKSDVWWQQAKSKLSLLNASVYQFDWAEIQAFAALLERSMAFSLTISGESAFIAAKLGECEVSWHLLQQKC